MRAPIRRFAFPIVRRALDICESHARRYEIPIFLFMGLAGGLIGATFNATNRQIAFFRRRVMTRPWHRFGRARATLHAILAFCFDQSLLPLPATRRTGLAVHQICFVNSMGLSFRLVESLCIGVIMAIAGFWLPSIFTCAHSTYAFPHRCALLSYAIPPMRCRVRAGTAHPSHS